MNKVLWVNFMDIAAMAQMALHGVGSTLLIQVKSTTGQFIRLS